MNGKQKPQRNEDEEEEARVESAKVFAFIGKPKEGESLHGVKVQSPQRSLSYGKPVAVATALVMMMAITTMKSRCARLRAPFQQGVLHKM